MSRAINTAEGVCSFSQPLHWSRRTLASLEDRAGHTVAAGAWLPGCPPAWGHISCASLPSRQTSSFKFHFQSPAATAGSSKCGFFAKPNFPAAESASHGSSERKGDADSFEGGSRHLQDFGAECEGHPGEALVDEAHPVSPCPRSCPAQ